MAWQDGMTAEIQPFDISKQKFLGPKMSDIPVSTLFPFKEDAVQAAARIVREATENK